MKIICISGKAHHGKDEVAKTMKETLEDNGYSVLITHYGDLVKYICTTFFDWDGEKDEKGRGLLQYVGTDVVRNRDPDYWVRFICDILSFFPDRWDYVLIPDNRFPNEVSVLSNAKFDVKQVRVQRTEDVSPLTKEQQDHISETALDNCTADHYIANNGTLADLKEKVSNWVLDEIGHCQMTLFKS